MPGSTTASKKPIPITANEFIEQQLHERLVAIEDKFTAHALSFSGPLYLGVDDILRATIENRCIQKPASDKLVVVLTTTGGYIEVVQRIVATIRKHYAIVDFVIPNYAYSAGTVFALSGDAIFMDYYSRLGPIDPQIETSKGMMVSALGHLEKYKALVEKAQKGKISPAEVQLLIDGFDQAELYNYEQAIELSVAALEEWLVKYKFKNWRKTETRKLAVTARMKKQRAASIGKKLNDTKRWHSHGYGISMEVLRKELNLKIDDFGADPPASLVIRSYSDLLSDYMSKRGTRGVVHINSDYRSFM